MLPADLEISTDLARIDLDVVYGFLRNIVTLGSKRAPGEVVERSIANSIAFSAYTSGQQVAFARVVMDGAGLAYLADVFVVPEFRGRGISKALMRAVLAHPTGGYPDDLSLNTGRPRTVRPVRLRGGVGPGRMMVRMLPNCESRKVTLGSPFGLAAQIIPKLISPRLTMCCHSPPIRLFIALTLPSFVGGRGTSTPSSEEAAPAASAAPATRNSHQDGRPETTRSLKAGPSRCRIRPLPRRVDLGIVWRRVRRESRIASGSPCAENCHCRGRCPWTPYVGTSTAARQFHRQWRRHHRDLSARAEARLGAPVPAFDHRVQRRRRSRRPVAAPRQAVQQLPCGRGPHQIKISPYDKEKHVWIIDDQLHVIYRFTYDGKLVHTLGELGMRGRGPNTFDRPTDIAWLPDGTYFISDGYGGTRVAKFDPNDKFIMDWGSHRPIRRTRAPTSGTRSTASPSARPQAVHRRSWTSADAGVRRERQVPRHVAAALTATGRPARTPSW